MTIQINSKHLTKSELHKLSAAKKKVLLARLMGQKNKQWPVSYGQEALWFLQQRTADMHANNVAACLAIESEVAPYSLRNAIEKLITRHPMLRSRYVSKGGKLKQIIDDEPALLWAVQDIDSLGVEAVEAVITDAYQAPFDLARGPICRGHLYRRAKKEWYFLFVVHHIAADGWSLRQLMDELQKLCTVEFSAKALSRGGPQKHQQKLPKFNYRDFVLTQRATLDSKEGRRQLDYWRSELSGELPILQLPTDKPRPLQQTLNGDGITQRFSPLFVRAYKRFCRERLVTPFMCGLALYFVLLHRLSNQERILVATPTAGRINDNFLDVVGYFVNPMPILANLADDPQFVDFLNHIKTKVLDAQANQDVPFPVIVDRLKVNRNPSYPVLCQAMFAHQNLNPGTNTIGFDSRSFRWGSLKARHYPLHQQEGQFDLGLELLEGETSLTAHWKFNSDLFSHSTVQGMADAFEQLALHAMESPGFNVSEIRLLGKNSAPKLMRPPQAHHEVDECLHEKFSKVTQRYADKTAVTCGNDSVTYAELDRQSSLLSR